MDLLEKRVKSRFSHRQIFLFPPATFGDFVEMARDALTVPNDIADESFITKFNQAVEVIKIMGRIMITSVKILYSCYHLQCVYICFDRAYSKIHQWLLFYVEYLISQKIFVCFLKYV